MTPKLAAAAFQQLLEPLERAVRLALGLAADQHAAGGAADQPARRLEFVLIVEPGAVAVRVGQAVARARIGVGGPAALPGDVAPRVQLGDLPLDLEVGAAQAQRLLHLEALARRSLVRLVDAAV